MDPRQRGISLNGIQIPEDGVKRLAHRRTVDYGCPYARWTHSRSVWHGANPLHKGRIPCGSLRPDPSYIVEMMPPEAYAETIPLSSLATKFVHTSQNKIKHPVTVVKWTIEGRRLITGSSSGEFTLWNGLTFNFETIMQAHDVAIRACEYSHDGDWFLSGDQDGYVKYWQPNMNNVKVITAHSESIREISFSPNDSKFLTASDDGTLKIWNFDQGIMERVLQGHGWDVKCADWHSRLGLVVSGSKDHLVKFWDPRTTRPCLTTLHGHKNTVTKCQFQPTGGGYLLATSSRDHTVRVFDIRAMKDLVVLRSSDKDVLSIRWHPVQSSLLSTGSYDGSISHFFIDTLISDNNNNNNTSNNNLSPAFRISHAHDAGILALDYHPLGHILSTGSNDRFTRFWARPRPGDAVAFKDRYYLGTQQAEAMGYGPLGSNNPRAVKKAQEELTISNVSQQTGPIDQLIEGVDDDQQQDQDEQQGLVDQVMPGIMPGLASLQQPQQQVMPPGMTFSNSNTNNNNPPPPLPPPGFIFPGMKPS